jgi:DNA-binding NarL/FixJ family response regulator
MRVSARLHLILANLSAIHPHALRFSRIASPRRAAQLPILQRRGRPVAIRVVLLDDHAPFRSYLARLLAQQEPLVVVGEAGELDALLQLLAGLAPGRTPDVLLMDVGMPHCSGPALTSAVLTTHPTLRVLALSMHDDPAFVAAMMAAGARGYILKDDPLTDIVAAIREVAAGRNFFSLRLGNSDLRSPHNTD